jgi:ribose transport system permease protein
MKIRSLLKGIRFNTSNLPIPAAVAFLIISLGTATKSTEFLTLSNFAVIADQAAITMIIACGLTFVILMGSIDLSTEGLIAASAMATSLLIANDRTLYNFGFWVFPVGLAVGALIGLLAGVIVTRVRIPSFIVTIATWNLGLGIGYILFGSASQPGVTDEDFLRFGYETILGLTKPVWTAIIVVIVSMLIQRFTKFGRYAYVIGGSEEIAILSGIDVKKYRTLALSYSGAMSGLAGSLLVTRMGIGAVNSGQGLLFASISSVVIGGTLLNGGRGGILHSIVGVLIMVTMSISMILLDVSSYYQGIVQGAVVIIVISAAAWRHRRPLRVVV